LHVYIVREQDARTTMVFLFPPSRLVQQGRAKVCVDPELTGQVIINLIDNAIKYAYNSQAIRLNILPPSEKQQYQYIPLEVQDFGQGMTSDLIQRVTERFYRGNNERPRGGMGLGLAIASEVCRLQGGFLKVQSELKKGTIITIYLPIAEQIQNF
jgi:signal transduction histidine kinase